MRIALLAFILVQDAEWKALFDGRTLDAFVQEGSAKWKVEEGAILGGQEGDPKRSGFLATKELFQDFEVEFEFMIDEHGKYNSGVYIRNEPGRAGRNRYQINIGRAAAGEFCGGIVVHRGGQVAFLARGDEKDEVRKPREWNAMRILARGAHLEVDLNGRRVSDYTDPNPDPAYLQKGTIGLQTYGAEGHAGWVKFRNIRIREIKG